MHIIKCSRFISTLSAIFLFLIALIFNNIPIMIIATFLLWASNVIFSLENLKQRMFLLMFHISFFVFLLGRPVFQLVGGDFSWSYSEDALRFAVFALFISLFFIGASAIIYSSYLNKNKKMKYKISETSILNKNNIPTNFIKGFRLVSLAIFACGIFANYYVGAGKIAFSLTHTYVEYYILYNPSHNFIITNFSSLMPYAMCFFLATKPKKLISLAVLALYFLSTLPDFIVGMRGPIMLASIFIFLYYFYRDTVREKDEKKWIGKFELIALIIAVPVLLSFMAIYSNIRENKATSGFSITSGLPHFFIQQGITFEVLGVGYDVKETVLEDGFKLFTFGSVVNLVKYGFMGRFLLGTTPLPSGNNIDKVIRSHNLSHPLSYYHSPTRYSEGRGLGSSYILEPYYDFGYVGIIIFSIFLGIFLIWMLHRLQNSDSISINALILAFLTTIFFIPRNGAFDWFAFVFKPQFLLIFFLSILFAKLCIKKITSTNLNYSNA